MSDVTFDMNNNKMEVHQRHAEPWKVTLVDTGESTMTGGRLKRVAEHIKDEESFCFTYGDGLSDIDISATLKFHNKHGKLATVVATYPPGRFGALDIEDGAVKNFKEKPRGDGGMINGGFFVLSPKVIDYLNENDNTIWEQGPLKQLSKEGQLMAWTHDGFWQPMDTLRDKQLLEEYWINNTAPWKKW
jgi:glucose-1-phosphate cytidylyltransferase